MNKIKPVVSTVLLTFIDKTLELENADDLSVSIIEPQTSVCSHVVACR